MDLPGPRCNAAIAALVISSVLLLSYGIETTVLSIDELSSDFDGARVMTHGILTSLKRYESGTEILMLIDELGQSSLKVVCTPSAASPPSSQVSIGDELRAKGEISFGEEGPILFTVYGEIEQISSSENALELSTLRASWQLFEGDRFDLTGLVEHDSDGTYRLFDEHRESSIALWPCESLGTLRDGFWILDCTLVFDSDVFVTGLQVWAIRPVA